MSLKLSSKATIAIVVALMLFSVVMAFENVSLAQTSPQIPVYKVVGSADLSNPGTASYWNNIPWINISLTANIPNAPTSGLTHYLLVKAVWNGSWLFILEEWPSPNPAYNAWSAAAGALYPSASGPGLFRIIELTPGTTYTVENNYTNYVSIVNGKQVTGRIVFNYSGITLPAPNGTQIYVMPNGTILLYHSLRPMEELLYSDGMFYGYYANSTWYYPDRAAIMWYLGSGTPTKDGMYIGGKYPGQQFDGFTLKDAGGSLVQQGGSANIWMWVSGATWNNATYDPAFKANLWENESLTGLPYVDPGDHGFAVPLYTNNTNMYEVDTSGIWYAPVASSGLNGSLFFIWTGAKYVDGNWIIEFARPLAVPPAYEPYMPNITVGKTYYVAFAVWQGPLGETLFDKSITPSFLTLQLVTTPPTTTTSTTSTSTTSTSTTSAPSVSSSIPSTTLDVTLVGVVIAIVALIALYVVYRR
ncbi:MAG: cytochrome b558/566 subunit A [Candidatus Aramenus sulfurataquae]|uniref:Cytochrome b558/566 subunit A n=1 Tax=Candidatus Aramenus sulfurataquae TaxID=1326980 RepID=W7KVR0_9CREN|nr:MAG: cytochrome b558/566 subunit A [Candidatus Aramenus sulfurataquae]